MELRQLRYFVAVADEMHFGRAAAKLHVVQPALSRQIAALEAELGVTLLKRSRRGVEFTPAGELFYEEARESLQRIERAAVSARLTEKGELGTLSIGYIIPAMWSVLLPTLQEYRRRRPELGFDLVELDGHYQVQRLRDALLDVGFLRPIVEDDRIGCECIARERLAIALPSGHSEAAADAVDLGRLREETFLVMSRRLGRRQHDLYLSVLRDRGLAPPTIEANTPAALSLVAARLAVALVPESFASAAGPGVVVKPITGPPATVDLCVAYRRHDPSPAALEFLEVVRAVAGSLPDAVSSRLARDSAAVSR